MVWIAAGILHTWGVKCEKQKPLTVRDGGGETDNKSLGHWWHNWPTEAGWSLLYVFPVNWDNIHTHRHTHLLHATVTVTGFSLFVLFLRLEVLIWNKGQNPK